MHFDLCGPFHVESIGRSRYFLLGTDDFSRWRVVKFLHKKSDAAKMFEEIQAECERHFSEKNYKIGAIRTDNGGEFTSEEFLSALRRDGIQAQTTVPHTPQEDGVSENGIVTGAIVCSRVTYSICRYDNNTKSKRGYS
jgi:transposase InsO family protein